MRFTLNNLLVIIVVLGLLLTVTFTQQAFSLQILFLDIMMVLPVAYIFYKELKNVKSFDLSGIKKLDKPMKYFVFSCVSIIIMINVGFLSQTISRGISSYNTAQAYCEDYDGVRLYMQEPNNMVFTMCNTARCKIRTHMTGCLDSKYDVDEFLSLSSYEEALDFFERDISLPENVRYVY